jgi:hypothetical protein
MNQITLLDHLHGHPVVIFHPDGLPQDHGFIIGAGETVEQALRDAETALLDACLEVRKQLTHEVPVAHV